MIEWKKWQFSVEILFEESLFERKREEFLWEKEKERGKRKVFMHYLFGVYKGEKIKGGDNKPRRGSYGISPFIVLSRGFYILRGKKAWLPFTFGFFFKRISTRFGNLHASCSSNPTVERIKSPFSLKLIRLSFIDVNFRLFKVTNFVQQINHVVKNNDNFVSREYRSSGDEISPRNSPPLLVSSFFKLWTRPLEVEGGETSYKMFRILAFYYPTVKNISEICI